MSRNCESSARRDGAFTLLELLIVIGIMTLLASLLYPVLRRSHEAAKTAACLNNLRQMGIIIQTYLNDNNGLMPSLQNRGSIQDSVPAMDTVLITSPTPSKSFRCPMDHNHLFETTGNSYFWNFTVNGQDIGHLFSVVGGDDPAQIPLVSDKEGFHPDVKDRVNILYADGRASRELKFSTSLPPP